MSQKTRFVVPSRLLVVEGETELAFCLFIKRSLGRNTGVKMVIENAQGGSPKRILQYAARLAGQVAYDRVAVLLDADIPLGAEALAISHQIGARVITPSPCIEAMFLLMLGHRIPSQTKRCKQAFHSNVLDPLAKLDADSYIDLFPVKSFTALEAECPVFAELLGFFRGH